MNCHFLLLLENFLFDSQPEFSFHSCNHSKWKKCSFQASDELFFLQRRGCYCPGVTMVTAVMTTTVWSCPPVAKPCSFDLKEAEREEREGRTWPLSRGFPRPMIDFYLQSSETHWLMCLTRTQGGKMRDRRTLLPANDGKTQRKATASTHSQGYCFSQQPKKSLNFWCIFLHQEGKNTLLRR